MSGKYAVKRRIVQIAAGDGNTLYALADDDTLWRWVIYDDMRGEEWVECDGLPSRVVDSLPMPLR